MRLTLILIGGGNFGISDGCFHVLFVEVFSYAYIFHQVFRFCIQEWVSDFLAMFIWGVIDR